MMEVSASERMPLPLGADLRRLVAGNCAPWARAPKTRQRSVAWHRLQVGENLGRFLKSTHSCIEGSLRSPGSASHALTPSIHSNCLASPVDIAMIYTRVAVGQSIDLLASWAAWTDDPATTKTRAPPHDNWRTCRSWAPRQNDHDLLRAGPWRLNDFVAKNLRQTCGAT